MRYCPGCEKTLPVTEFYNHPRSGLYVHCRPCNSAANRARYREVREQKLAAMEPWERENVERRQREQEARQRANAAKREERDALKAVKEAQRAEDEACKAAAKHRRKYGPARPRAVSLERERLNAERVAYLVALLSGTTRDHRISTDEQWDMIATELSKLWLQSGDKACTACGQDVPAAQMHAPGPANFYPGKCKPCVRSEYERRTIATYGCLPTPRMLPMLDGTEITIGELARRHRAREATRKEGRSVLAQNSEVGYV